MSKCLFFILLLINCNLSFAQKFIVLQTQKNSITFNIPQQEMLIQSEMSKSTLYNIHSKNIKGYKLQSQLQSVIGKLNMFGQEKLFNSNDTSTLNIEGGNSIKNLLTNSREITIQNNQIINSQKDTTDLFFSMINEDVTKYYLTIPTQQIRLGYNWSDSLVDEKNENFSDYYISNITKDAFEVTQYASIKKQEVLSQNNQKVRQELKGYSNSTRWYSLATQLLQREENFTKLVGTSESGNTRFPLTIESKMSITIKQL